MNESNPSTSLQTIKNCFLVCLVGFLIVLTLAIVDGSPIGGKLPIEWFSTDSFSSNAEFVRFAFFYDAARFILFCGIGAWILLRLKPRKTFLFGLTSAVAMFFWLEWAHGFTLTASSIANPSLYHVLLNLILIFGVPLLFWSFNYLQRTTKYE